MNGSGCHNATAPKYFYYHSPVSWQHVENFHREGILRGFLEGVSKMRYKVGLALGNSNLIANINFGSLPRRGCLCCSNLLQKAQAFRIIPMRGLRIA